MATNNDSTKATSTNNPPANKAKPVHEIRLGRIRAAVWLNETENGSRYKVQISRLYKDKDDKWNDSSSFGRDDLPLVCKVADQAMVWIYENPVTSEKEPEEIQ